MKSIKLKALRRVLMTLGIGAATVVGGNGLIAHAQNTTNQNTNTNPNQITTQSTVHPQAQNVMTQGRYAHRAHNHKNYFNYYDLGHQYLSNQTMNNLRHYHNTDAMYKPADLINYTRYQPKAHTNYSTYLGRYRLYHINTNQKKFRSAWVLRNNLQRHRYARVPTKSVYPSFSQAMNSRYVKHYLTRRQRKDYYHLAHDYNNLDNNEDNYNNVPDSEYNQEYIDWLNFYRHDIFHEDPVQEDSQFDSYAQNAINNNQDPEDCEASTIPLEIDSYITDQDDADDNNQTTHRSSVLNPYADYVGVGRANGWNSLYFNWGLDDGAGDCDPININYPAKNLFPMYDARHGEFWTHSFIENPYNDGKAVRKPRVSVYDNTDHHYLHVYNVHTSSSEIYYNVNPHRLHLYHTYTIRIKGNRHDHDSVRYKTTLVDLYNNDN